MKWSKEILCLVAVLMISAPAWAQKDNAKANSQAASTPAPQAATTDPSYKIGATDELAISVWEQQDLSRTVPVRPDGMISLPLLNDIPAAGKTPMELRDLITEKLKNNNLVKDPQVTVVVTAMNSQRVYISGQVMRAGAYPLLPGMTVLQGLTSAGGFSTYANESKITILRKENGQEVRLPFNYKDVIRGRNTAQNILLKPGDTIIVP